MIHKFLWVLVGIAVLIVPSFTLAVDDDFTITTIIGSDTLPPSTPVLQTVVPVAPTQIDITWSASVDDFAVSGYRLFRDSVQIATTTLLSYSDTGLTPSTTYSYTVDAFDAYFNFSSTSLPIATTTFSIVVPPTPTSTPSTSSSGGGTRTAPLLVTLTVTPSERSVLFAWETNVPTKYILTLGRTTAYELASVSGGVYKQNHLTMIDALEPGTRYYYKLTAINARGQEIVISTDSFITKSSVTIDSLPNVQNFAARADNSDVQLSWRNTFTNSEHYVRIVRSHLFYPGTIQSGAVVYEGRGQSFTDQNALSDRSPQYYTIFVLDRSGNVSSGAVARAFREGTVLQPTTPSSTPTDTNFPSTIPPDIGSDSILQASSITILQLEQTYWFENDIELSARQPYLISIPYNALPKNLKSIIVSIQNPSNQREVSAYLLKLNQAGDAYTALIPAPGIVGRAGIMIEVFDYEQATVRRISTSILYVDTDLPVPFFPDRLLQYCLYGIALCFFFIFWWLLLLLLRRRKGDD